MGNEMKLEACPWCETPTTYEYEGGDEDGSAIYLTSQHEKWCPIANSEQTNSENGLYFEIREEEDIQRFIDNWNRRPSPLPESEYDRAVAALALVLPKCVTHVAWIPSNGAQTPWAFRLDVAGYSHGIVDLGAWSIPDPPEGDSGYRRISAGKVVPAAEGVDPAATKEGEG